MRLLLQYFILGTPPPLQPSNQTHAQQGKRLNCEPLQYKTDEDTLFYQ